MARGNKKSAHDVRGVNDDQLSDPIAAVNEKVRSEVARRRRIIRNFPAAPIEEPLSFAKQIFEFGSGESVRRLNRPRFAGGVGL